MPSFETFVFVIFGVGLLACWRVQQWAKKASENPAVKEKAKEIGLGLLSKWLKK